MTDLQLLRSDLISSDEGRVLAALSLLRESVTAVLAQKEAHPLDSLFAKYCTASPEFSEVIVAWDSQSAKETKISLLCVHVLIDSFKCCDIMGSKSAACASKLLRRKGKWFSRLISGKPKLACLVLRLLSALVVISGSVARDCVLHFALDAKPMLDILSRGPKEAADGALKKSSNDSRSAGIDLVSSLLCSGNSFVLGHVSQIKGLMVAPLKHMVSDSERVAARYLSALHVFATSRDIADAARVKVMSHPAMISRLRAFISEGVSDEVYLCARRLISALFIDADALVLLKDAVPSIVNPSFAVRNSSFKTFVTGLPLDDHRVSDFMRACCSGNPELQLLIFRSLHYSSAPRPTPVWTKSTFLVLQMMLIEPTVPLLSNVNGDVDVDDISSMIVDWILPSTFQLAFFKACISSDMSIIVNLALEVMCAALLRLRWCVESLRSSNELIVQRIRSTLQHRIPDLNVLVGVFVKARGFVCPISKGASAPTGPTWSIPSADCIMCRTAQLLKFYVMMLPSAAIESKFDVTKLCVDNIESLSVSCTISSDTRLGTLSELFALFNSSPPGVQRSSLDYEKRFISEAATFIASNNSSSLTVSAQISIYHFLMSNQLILPGLEGRAQCFITLSLLSSSNVNCFRELVQEALTIRSASMTVNVDATQESWVSPMSRAVASFCDSRNVDPFFESVLIGFNAFLSQVQKKRFLHDKKLSSGHLHPALLLGAVVNFNLMDCNQILCSLADVEHFHRNCSSPGCHEYFFLVSSESLLQLIEHQVQVDLSALLSSYFDIICRCIKSSKSTVRLEICNRIRESIFPKLSLAMQRKDINRSNVSIVLTFIVSIAQRSSLRSDADVLLSTLINQLSIVDNILPTLIDCCHAFSKLLVSIPASSSLDLVITCMLKRITSSNDSIELLLQCISSILRVCSQSHIHYLESETLASFIATMFKIMKQPQLCKMHVSSVVRPISLVLQRFVSPLDFASLSQGFKQVRLTIDDTEMNTILTLEQFVDCRSEILHVVRYLCMSSMSGLQFFINALLQHPNPSLWWLAKPVICVYFDTTRYLQGVQDADVISTQLMSSLSTIVDISKNIEFSDDFSVNALSDVNDTELGSVQLFDRTLCRQLLEMSIMPNLPVSCISAVLEDCVSAPLHCLEQSLVFISKLYALAIDRPSNDAELLQLEHQVAQVIRICEHQHSAVKESFRTTVLPHFVVIAKVLFSQPLPRIQTLSMLCDFIAFISPIGVPSSREIAGYICSSQNLLDVLEAHDAHTYHTLKCLRLLADHDTGVATQELLQHALFAFTCSLSETDDEIRRIIAHCDANGFKLTSEGYSWGSSRSSHSGWDWIFAGQFDSKRVMSCAQSCPSCHDSSVAKWNRDLSSVYDAGYILAMVEVGIRELNDIKIIPQLIDSGILTLSIKMTASSDEKLRAYSYNVLALVLSLFESPSAAAYPQMVIDYSQIQMLLTCLKNSITAPLQQLPNLFSAMIAESVTILGRPNHPLFETFTRLLLRTPVLDVTDLNWVSVVLGNEGVEFKSHMMWALRVLKHGIVGESDIACLRRRRLVAAICNLYDSRACDNIMRSSVRDVLFNIATHRLGATYLIDHCGIFPWCVALLPTSLQHEFSVLELRSSHLQRGEQELRFALRMANRCAQSCIRFGRTALLLECSVLLLASFSEIFGVQSSPKFSSIKSTAKSWLQLAAFVLEAKKSGLKGGGDIPVFIHVYQLHSLLSFAHRAYFVHGDSEIQDLLLSVVSFLPGSWIAASKWAERTDSLSELLSWLFHSCWKTKKSIAARCNTAVALVSWSASQVPIVRDSVAYLLLIMLISVWRWLTPDQRELIKSNCPPIISFLSPSEAPALHIKETSDSNGNRKRAKADDRKPHSSFSTKNPKL